MFPEVVQLPPISSSKRFQHLDENLPSKQFLPGLPVLQFLPATAASVGFLFWISPERSIRPWPCLPGLLVFQRFAPAQHGSMHNSFPFMLVMFSLWINLKIYIYYLFLIYFWDFLAILNCALFVYRYLLNIFFSILLDIPQTRVDGSDDKSVYNFF